MNITSHSPGSYQLVTQNRADGQQIAPGFEVLAQAVADILKQLPALGLPAQDQEDVEEVANEVLGEVVQAEPNRGRLRRAAAALRGFLMPVAAGAIAGVGEEAQELAKQAVEHLASAVT
ncbi:hypothetical protein [Actinoplanes sp. NPDC026619]|uniref:hypothetical protein n=1 Tax=Actinoplanes sp. NPDC026619 TaxID=3155798 RepID=UPI00340AF22C